MSGIGNVHNKFNSCYGCPDRSVDPNCHDTCRGYLYRQAERTKINEQKIKDFEYKGCKIDRVADSKKKAKRYRR
jgi:hypothetical protein